MSAAVEKPTVTIYTDGGAEPNPGYGGWGAVLLFAEHQKELSGHGREVTNNQMELSAAIHALQALKRPCRVALYTDSQYLQKGISQWLPQWQAANWTRRQNGQTVPIPNADLWQRLVTQTERHEVAWHWVKGHAGNRYNERVDELATAARLSITPTTAVDEKIAKLYLRASCLGNPGPGGWAAILEPAAGESASLIIEKGGEPATTNNRMELQAVLAGLTLVPRGTAVQLFTTSDYISQGVTQWLPGWVKRNWQKKDGTAIANADLWQQLQQELTRRPAQLYWINAKRLAEASELLKQAGQTAVVAAEQQKNKGKNNTTI